MALSPAAALRARIAFQRFGLGARPGGPAAIGADAKAALIAEVNTPNIALIDDPRLPGYVKACFESQKGSTRADAIREQELNARVDKHMSVRIGFVERLVMFWTNHFAMDIHKTGAVLGTIGQWERDVVRRRVFGKFYNMLKETYEHPAMLAFLDNDGSVGPNSPIGKYKKVGTNANLGREILELHTLGSDGGYNEKDVLTLADVLTGWSYVRGYEADANKNGWSNANRGQFFYKANWHEPGTKTLMGKPYPDTGKGQLELVLTDLANHPATAEHIAFKLVRHFITDNPTVDQVDQLTQVFLSTNGDLKAVSLALLDLPGAWDAKLTKFRTPFENTVAQYRALGKRYPNDKPWILAGTMRALDHMQWESMSPEGYSDDTPSWLNPDAVRIRVDAAFYTAPLVVPNFNGNVVELAVKLFDSVLSGATKQSIIDAAFPKQQLTVLFSSPEFQRR